MKVKATGRRKAPIVAEEPPDYRFRDLLLLPGVLTAGAAVAATVVALVTGGPEVYGLAFGFVLGLSAVFFGVTIFVGGLGLIVAWIGRFRRRRARARAARPGPAAGWSLWDPWVDGP